MRRLLWITAAASTFALLLTTAVNAQTATATNVKRLTPATCRLDTGGVDGSDHTAFPCHQVDVIDWSNGRTSFVAHLGPKSWGEKIVFDFGGLTSRGAGAMTETIDHATVVSEDKPTVNVAVTGACALEIMNRTLQGITCNVVGKGQTYTLQSTFAGS